VAASGEVGKDEARAAQTDEMTPFMGTERNDPQLLIEQFVEGSNTSLSLANRLEVLLDEMFPADAYIQGIVVALASYRPGGGEFLYDTSEMQRQLARASTYLSRLHSQR
jgi:hypothetical protein